MKKTIAVVMALMLALCLCPAAMADFYAEVYNTDFLNVRTGPGSGYEWLASLPQGEQVRVTGESGNWYQVRTNGGVNGYASKNYLRAVQSAAVQGKRYAVVYNTDSLNIRTGPGTEYNYLGSMARGKWVEILEESGSWCRVRVIGHDTVPENVTAYMSKNFLQTAGNSAGSANTATVVNPAGTRFLNLRATPSYSADVLGIFYNGAQCTVLERRGDGWSRVSINVNGATLFGYFRSEYLSFGGNGSSVGSATVNTRLNGGTGGSLNLREEPSTESYVSSRIPNGAQLTVLLKGDPFWLVEYNGAQGFADSSYINGGSTGGNAGTSGGTVVRTGNSGKLNLREQANSNARVLGQFSNGTAVRVLEQGTAWCYVEVGGQTGYMMTKFLSIGSSTATKQVYNSNGGTYVNLRSAPQKSSGNVNVRVPSGATVNLLSWGEEWSQVSYNGTTGYMMSWFLR